MPPPNKKRPLASLASRISPPPAAGSTTASVTAAVTSTKRVKIKSTTTKSAVANFFKPTSQKAPEPTTWRVSGGTLLVGRYRSPSGTAKEVERTGPTKVAGFDLDGTLIKTLSGTIHSRTASDWTFWSPHIPSRLLGLHRAGYHIAIFSNQAGLKSPHKDSANLTKFKLKVAAVLATLDLPITVYAATARDGYRKPGTGMWSVATRELKGDVDLNGSYLVGDAAGRKGDFSDSDKMWAAGVGIGFFTPEEFFLGRKKDEKIVDVGASSCDEGEDEDGDGDGNEGGDQDEAEEHNEKTGEKEADGKMDDEKGDGKEKDEDPADSGGDN